MRLFVAIDIDPQIRGGIERVQQQLKHELNLSGREAKWVRPEQIHLTLKFLGEVRDDALTSVCEVVTQTASRHDGFDLQVRGMGVFGRPARVVWAGIEPCLELMKLQSELEDKFEKLGWKKENRPFSGHLTVCRVKTFGAGKKLGDAIERWNDEIFGTVWARQVVLYESRLSPSGPEYGVVCTAPLK